MIMGRRKPPRRSRAALLDLLILHIITVYVVDRNIFYVAAQRLHLLLQSRHKGVKVLRLRKDVHSLDQLVGL